VAICIEARQAKAAMGAMPNKTDRNDARGIAQIMRTGWYRAVHVKTPSCRTWRALLTARRMVVNKRRDVENGVRALLREAGLKVGTPSRKNFATRVGELVADDPVLAALATSLLSVIDVRQAARAAPCDQPLVPTGPNVPEARNRRVAVINLGA
jgi:transposase